MTTEEFDKEIEETLDHVRDLLIIKGKEYQRNNNPLHNFDVGARKKNKSREEILDGMLLKHEISMEDIVNDISEGILPTKEKLAEKTTDILIYTLIRKASIMDKINNQ